MNILITGGASGLGEAITRNLVKDINNNVYFTFSGSESNANKIESEYSNAFSIKCDFRDPAAISDLCNQVASYEIDVLINNAYVNFLNNTHFHKIPEDDFLNDFKYNILPVIQITQAAIDHFRKKKNGKIITILTSYLVNSPPIGLSGYVANKAYLSSLVKSWANENSKFNILSVSVSPSFMLTNLNANVDERIIEQMVADHPLKKLLTVEEVADTVRFIVKNSGHLNGSDIIINSGTHLK